MINASLPIHIPPYAGQLSQRFAESDFLHGLADIQQRFQAPEAVLHTGEDPVVLLRLDCGGRAVRLAVKSYGARSFLADRGFRRSGSRARRSWHGACLVRSAGLAAPEPVAFLERWDGNRLKEAYYLSVLEPGALRLSRELIRLTREQPDGPGLAEVVHTIAEAIAALHRAHILHGRLHEANLLLRPLPGAAQYEVQFTGLHEAQQKNELNLRECVRDVASLPLPPAVWRSFAAGYFGGDPPPEFEPLLRRHRRRSKAIVVEDPAAPGADRQWIWEPPEPAAPASDRDAEPETVAGPNGRAPAPGPGADAISLPDRYADAYVECFRRPVSMVGRVGISVEPQWDHQDRELEWLAVLGKAPVLIRLYCHRGPSHWERATALVERMSAMGRPVGIALVQDRQSVTAPKTWDRFVATVMDQVHADVDWVEVGHAVDDPAWGVTRLEEYQRMLRLLPWLRNQYPSVRFMGPATSQWDVHHAYAACRQVPPEAPWKALSAHLNLRHDIMPESVDDGIGLDLLERCAWLRALAAHAPECDDRLIVSEASYSLRSAPVRTRPGAMAPHPAQGHGLSEVMYAQYMIRYLLIAICSGMVERVYWWRLVAARFGLIDDADPARWRARPAFRMLSNFLHSAGRSTYMARRLDEDRRYYLFRTPEKEALVLAYTTLPERKTEIPFPARGVFDAYGEEQPLIQEACILTGSPLYFSGVQDIRWFYRTEDLACQQRA